MHSHFLCHVLGCRLHQSNLPSLKKLKPNPFIRPGTNHELLLCGKVILEEFLSMLLDSLVNHEWGKCSVKSNAFITNKHTVLTNIFSEVTVMARQSPKPVSVFAQSSPTKSKNLLLFPTFLAYFNIIVDAKFRCSE